MSKGEQGMEASKGRKRGKMAVVAAVESATPLAEGEAPDGLPKTERDDLMESLKKHDLAFNSLLSLIPAQFYLAIESEGSSVSDEMKGISTKYMKNKRKQDKAIEAADRKAHIKEAKRAKLDPDNFKSVVQIQQERASAKKISKASSDDMDFEVDDDALEGSRAGDTDSGEDDEDSSLGTQLTSIKGSDEAAEKAINNDQSPTGILDLRARLQAKIQGLQFKRKAISTNTEGTDGGQDDESVASTKDELLEERRKKRGEMRDKRRSAMKDRRKVEREQQDKKGVLSGSAKKGGPTANGTSKAPTLLVKDRTSGANAEQGQREGGPAASNDITFSAIKFDEDQKGKEKKNRHTLPSDPKVALAILESRKKKEEARAAKRGEKGDEASNKAADQERKERERWSKAEAAAQGVKIRDDESLLKKAAKKKDKVKDKSRQEWADREKEKSDKAYAKNKKRTDNIAARKTQSKKGGKGIGGKKMGAGGKAKQKARAGFEGKARSSSSSNKGSGKPQKSPRK
ncbi:hypothetical protein CBS101457_005787 [Exobasidium rhododendri]|nr:hypothetical protein CBS101457_005787 [Exobasidium rhododendri]